MKCLRCIKNFAEQNINDLNSNIQEMVDMHGFDRNIALTVLKTTCSSKFQNQNFIKKAVLEKL